jgi:hypothetical protein
MKTFQAFLGLLGFALLSAQLPAQQPPYRTDQILVKPKAGVAHLNEAHGRVGARIRKSFARLGNLQVVQIPAGNRVQEVIDGYRESGLVEYAEPDYIGTAASQKNPNESNFGNLWGLHQTSDVDIDAPEAWYL